MANRFQGGILGVGFNPLRAPDAPTNVTATTGSVSGRATVSFTAPSNIGGSAISSYAVLSSPGGIGATGSASPIDVNGLTNGTSYTFRVTALNSYGPSPFSNSSGSVTPIAVYPRIETFSGVTNTQTKISSLTSSASYLAFDASGIAVTKLNEDGSIALQRLVGSAAASGTAVDASGNIFVTGSTSGTGWLGKFNSSGTLQWQTVVKENSLVYGGPYVGDIMFDSAGNIYSDGVYANGYSNGYFVKYDSSGTVQFQKFIYTDGGTGFSIRKDTQGNNFYAGTTTFVSGYRQMTLFKLSSTGSYSWVVRLGRVGSAFYNTTYGGRPAIDPTGNVYLPGSGYYSGFYASIIAKVSTSGSVIWHKYAYNAGANFGNSTSIAAGASGYLYVTVTAGNDAYVLKIDSDANVIWQRKFTVTGQQITLTATSVDDKDNVYLSSYIYNQPCGVIVLPSAGIGTGTYTNNGLTYTIATSALSFVDGGLTITSLGSGTLSDASGVTSASGSLTVTTPSLTPVITSI